MSGNVTSNNGNKSIEERKTGKIEAAVTREADEALQQRILEAGIGKFSMIASFWSTTLENVKTHVGENASRASSFLNFDNGRVIASESFKFPIFSNPAIVKLFKKVRTKNNNTRETDELEESKSEKPKVAKATKPASKTSQTESRLEHRGDEK